MQAKPDEFTIGTSIHFSCGIYQLFLIENIKMTGYLPKKNLSNK